MALATKIAHLRNSSNIEVALFCAMVSSVLGASPPSMGAVLGWLVGGGRALARPRRGPRGRVTDCPVCIAAVQSVGAL